MFLLKYVLIFALVSSLSGNPLSVFGPNSVVQECTRDLCHFVPIIVSNKTLVPLQSRSVYKMMWRSNIETFKIVRWLKVTPTCWEMETLYWPPNEPNADAQISVDEKQPLCITERRGPPFIFSDLYVREDLWLGVLSISAEGWDRVQIVIANYYLYRAYYNIDWTAEVRSLMALHNDTLSEDFLFSEIGEFQDQFHLFKLDKICDPDCSVGPEAEEQDAESFSFSDSLEIYLIMIIVFIVCVMRIFK